MLTQKNWSQIQRILRRPSIMYMVIFICLCNITCLNKVEYKLNVIICMC